MADLALASRLVQGGGVVLLPTETVYGLSGDARRPDVAARIHQIKGSDPAKPMIALTDTWDRVAEWIEAPEPVRRVCEDSSLGAITLVLTASPSCPLALVSGRGAVGIRRSTSPWICELVEQTGAPIFSTSANPTGTPPPARFDAIDTAILRSVDCAVEADAPLAGQPSTVARFDSNVSAFEILRPGPVSEEDLRRVAGGG